MKMHQMSYFLAVCDEKSFTRAAERCGVKQPSITVAIKQLEDEIGSPLFERSNSAVRLTRLGNLVRPDFVRIDRSAALIKNKAEKFIASQSIARKPKAKETNMRAIALSVAAVAILLMGLALRPAPSATAASPELASAPADLYAIERTIDIKSLPELTVENSI
jgi:hypothetical protein